MIASSATRRTRTFDYYFRLLTDAGLGWDEAVQVAREMVTPSTRVGA